MFEVSDYWKKKAIPLSTKDNPGIYRKIKRDYLPVGDYVSEVLKIKDIKDFDTTVGLLFEFINQSRDTHNFICVRIGKSLSVGYVYGFWVRRAFRWHYKEVI